MFSQYYHLLDYRSTILRCYLRGYRDFKSRVQTTAITPELQGGLSLSWSVPIPLLHCLDAHWLRWRQQREWQPPQGCDIAFGTVTLARVLLSVPLIPSLHWSNDCRSIVYCCVLPRPLDCCLSFFATCTYTPSTMHLLIGRLISKVLTPCGSPQYTWRLKGCQLPLCHCACALMTRTMSILRALWHKGSIAIDPQGFRMLSKGALVQ